jgi:hypothetical protein
LAETEMGSRQSPAGLGLTPEPTMKPWSAVLYLGLGSASPFLQI